MTAEPNSWTVDTGHGFNEHGYLASPGDSLASMLVAWAGGELAGYADTDDGPGEVALRLVLRGPAGVELGHLDLPATLVRELEQALRRDIAAREAAEKADARRREMTALIVAARRQHGVDDLGNLVAYALAVAAAKVFGGVPRLTMGRPGSWEADIVRRMAETGGLDPGPGTWERLAELFEAMGQAKDDGGQVLSDALGYAARELGGLEALAASSGWWAHDLWNAAKSLNYDDQWEPWG